jgi:hypothetical protein
VFLTNILNDGRPDFTANPFNGPVPTYEQALHLAGLRRRIQTGLPSPDAQSPYSYQTSIGLQRQLGSTMSASADYVVIGTRHDLNTRNVNLTYNPDTGANYPFTNLSRLPYPQFGEINMAFTDLKSNYHALQTAFTKRFSKKWQGQATYTLQNTYDGTAVPLTPGCQSPLIAPGVCNVPFTVTKDLGGDYGWSGFQHRAVFNGIWEVGHGIQLSGLYFYQNGVRIQSSWGGDLRNTGATGTPGSPLGRLRPGGTIVPRYNFATQPLHRLDARLQRQFRLGGHAKVDGILEVFDLFNHANYGSYVTTEVSKNYGQPSFNSNIAYQPRRLQLGFRVAF